MANESRQWLYNTLKGSGLNVGASYDDFDKLMDTNEESRKWCYEQARRLGHNVGKDYNEFNSLVGPSTPVSQVSETEKANQQTIKSATPQSTTTEQPQEKQGWKPTLKQSFEFQQQMQQQMDDFNKKMEAGNQRIQNMGEYFMHGGNGHTLMTGLAYNPETQKIQSQYMSPSGNVYFDKAQADRDSQNYREAYDSTVGGQLRKANKRLADLKSQAEARRQEVIKQWETKVAENAPKKDESFWDSFRKALMMEAEQSTHPYTSGAQVDYMSDQKYRALQAAINQCEQNIQTLQNKKDQDNGADIGFWRGFGQVVGNLRTWDFGVNDLLDAQTMLQASDTKPEDMSDEERQMLQEIYNNQQTQGQYGDFGFWNRAGNMTGYMPSFMADFILTGGGAETINITTKAATRGATKYAMHVIGKEAIADITKNGVKSYLKREGVKGATKLAGDWAIKATGATVDELLFRAPIMTNTIQEAKTATDIINRKLGDVQQDENGNIAFENNKSWGDAVWQGEANAIIENYSEMFGTHLDPVLTLKNASKVAETFGAKRISKLLTSADAKALDGIAGTVKKQFERMGVSDFFGEVSEEYYGQLWRTMLNLDDAYQPAVDEKGNPIYKKDDKGNLVLDEKGNPIQERTNLFNTGQFHGDIWGGMALSMGMMGVGKYGLTSAAYGYNKHAVNKADKVASTTLSPEVWEKLRSTIDATDNENIGELAESIWYDKSLNNKERDAVMDYMEASLIMRGENLAELVRANSRKPMSRARQAAEDAYSDGLNADVESEGVRILRDKNYRGKKLLGAFGVDESIDPNDWLSDRYGSDEVAEIIKAIYEDEELTSEQRAAMVGYLKANSTYDGLMDGVENSIKEDIAQSNAFIDNYHNKKTKTMQPVKFMQGNELVDGFVVDGNVQMLEDGTTVDLSKSDHDVFIYAPDTGTVEMYDAADIRSMGVQESVEDAKARMAKEKRESAMQRAMAAINGTVKTVPGTVVPVRSNDGTSHQLTVDGFDEEGNVVLTDEEGKQVSMSVDELQQLSDNYNNQSFEEEVNAAEPEGISEEAAEVQREIEGMEVNKPYAKKGTITIKTPDGTTLNGLVTGRRDKNTNEIEVYTEEPLTFKHPDNRYKLEYFTEEELNQIGSDYVPYAETDNSSEGNQEDSNNSTVTTDDTASTSPVQTDVEGAPQAANNVTPETDQNVENFIERSLNAKYATETDDFKTSYANSVRKAQRMSNEGIIAVIKSIEADSEQPNDIGRGLLRAYTDVILEQRTIDGEQFTALFAPEQQGGNVPENAEMGTQIDGNVPENAEMGTQIGEMGAQNTELETQNGELEIPVDESVAQQSALERIPKDDKGKPQWTAVDADTAWDGLVERSNNDEERAKAFADNMVSLAEKALKKAEKAKTKPTEDYDEWEKAENERVATIASAKQLLEQWQRIAGTKERRKAEARRKAEEEARKKAAEHAAEEERKKAEQEEKDRIEREKLNGVPDWNIDKPTDSRARGYRRFGPKLVQRQAPIANAVIGKEVDIKFTDKDRPHGRVAVIEASQLQPSHLQGQRNPYHFIDEAQPKERDDKASILASAKIASDVRPEEITGSITAYTGAPTINARGEVIQGNNRADALRQMWESYKESRETYKQYLIDHAEEFGIDADAVTKMEAPVLVNMVDVADDEAIALGQHTADETESGGVERIKPKHTAIKLGKRMREFAETLLKGDSDASLTELVVKNGVDVLKWLNSIGAITDTQLQSAFDSKGYLTGEAKNDLKNILFQSIFTGAPTRLEEMFGKLPAHAQNAILATAFRDFDSRTADRMIEELQQSIIAYNALLGYEAFVNAKNIEEATRAIEGWKRSYVFDDVTGESYLPVEEFSNFALHLAAMYKTQTKAFLQATFNELYDLIQGAKEDNLFDKFDKTPKSLTEAIQQVLNIDYNGNNRNNVLDSSTSVSEEGQQGSDGDNRSGEQAPQGEEPTDNTGGTDSSNQVDDSLENEHAVATESEAGQSEVPKTADDSSQPKVPTILSEIPQEWKDSKVQSREAIHVETIDEIPDEVFTHYTNSVILPTVSKSLGEAIHSEGKPVLIKRGVFAKNDLTHGERYENKGITPQDSRQILNDALYNGDHVGRTQPSKKPNYWVVIKNGAKNSVIVLEVADTKDNLEIVGWEYRSDKNLQNLYNQAAKNGSEIVEVEKIDKREDGPSLIQASGETSAANLSALPLMSSEDKDSANSNEKQEDSTKKVGFTVKPTVYTSSNGKRKTNMFHLDFAAELTKEQMAAVRAFANETPDPEKPRAKRGWIDRDNGGWFFRTKEDAQKAGEIIGDEEAMQDNTPLSLEDVKEIVDDKAVGDNSNIANEEKAETPVVESKEEKEQVKSKWVDDEDAEEFARLREIMRKGMGRLNMGFPPELLFAGGKMSYLMMKHGVRKIAEYATAMIEELGESIRPHIKSLYEFTRYTQEVQSSDWASELSTPQEVADFDEVRFDKQSVDAIEAANAVVEAEESEKHIAETAKQIKDQRNSNRKKKDEQTSANTEVIAEQSEALASEVESQLENIDSEESGNQVNQKIDEQIETINAQLALLGYYEAEENDKDFNEAFGYMRNAEKKAVKDAEQLGKRLAKDLGIDLSNNTEKKGNKLVQRKLATANIAPAGGDITIRIPLNEGRELKVYVGMEPVSSRGNYEQAGSHYSNDNLEVAHIMFRIENPQGRGGYERFGTNNWSEPNVTYSELLSNIERAAYKFIPERTEKNATEYKAGDKVQYSPDGGKTWRDATYVQRGEDGKHRIDTGLAPVMWVNASDEQLRKAPAEAPRKESTDKEVMDGFYDNGINEDAVSEMSSDDSVQLAIVGVLNPMLTDMKPKAALEWLASELQKVSDEKLKQLKQEYIFKKGKDANDKKVLDAIQAEVARRSDAWLKEQADNAASGKSPFTVTPEVEQQLEEQQAHHGYKVGDRVLYKGNKATIHNFESTLEGVRPVLAEDGLAPVIYTVAERWEDIKPIEEKKGDIFEQAESIAAAEEKKQSEKTSNSKEKKVSLQDNQPIGDLFGGLFDDTINTTNNEKSKVQPRTGETERGGRQSVANEPLGTSTRDEAQRPDGRGMGGRGINNSRNDEERGTGVPQLPQSHKRLKPIAPEQRKNLSNNHAERGTDYAPKGVDARIRANIAAIELMQQLIASGEKATPQQMEVLRKYSGWGGLGKAFSNEEYNSRIRSLMSNEEYEDAALSRNSAYYTPATIIDTMWDIVRAMGFKGGRVLEGSAGIGNILGLMPSDFSERSSIHAVELDRTTGNILSLLYPDAKVDIQGFEATRIQNGSVDLAITNVPFVTGLHVIDNSGDKDLSTKFRDIHDFCIAKNVRKLREGGIGIFITSNGTLDNSTKLREWLVSEGGADVVGAFRLNNETFGGAGVTSDIIVVRKRVNGRKSAHAIDVSTVTGERTVEYETGDYKTVKGQRVPVVKTMTMSYNKYFIEHPECMAGEMKFAFENGDTYREGSRGLYPTRDKDQTKMLSEWSQGFKDMEAEQPREAETPVEQRTYDELGDGVKEGSMLIDSSGNVCVAQYGQAVPLMSARKNKEDKRSDSERIAQFSKNKIKGHTRKECFVDYCKIKAALANLLQYQTEHEDDKGLQPYLTALNKAFDDFVERYGNLHKNNQLAWLRNDMDFPSIVALETFEERSDKQGNKTATFGKTDIFSHRVVEKEQEPKPTNTKDGIIASIYKYGRIDMPYLADVLSKSEEEIKSEIISSGLGFENPVSRQMEVSYEYLSGNVREKLRQAQENNTNGDYDANIRALQKVIPDNIPAHLIEFTLGSSWIDPKLYEDYVKERTGITVRLKNVGGTWFMKAPEYGYQNETNRAAGVNSESLNITKYGHHLLEAAIQNKTVEISRTYKHADGSTEKVVDKEATAECSRKIDEFRSDFKDWARNRMQSDAELSERIEQVYNDQFNNYVAKSIPDDFVPEHFGGAATVVNGRQFKLRPHQAKAAIRATTQPVLLAHEVGTGKTFTLITAAMEMRRLGTARKPMIVVQNATVGQFVESAKSLYPNAKILTLEDSDRNAEGRKNFYAKIKYNDWDMIVVPQSVFEKIPDSEERQMKFVQERIDEKMRVLEQMKSEDPDGKSFIVKQAESEIAKQQEELNALTEAIQSKRDKKNTDEKKRAKNKHNAEVKALEMLDRDVDDVENFDDMGIDALLVDEAHEYKHLGFATAMQRGVKGVDPSYSKKSQGVFLKTQSVMERKNGRNVVFATGTPISNTAAEIWTFMRYLMPADTMKEYGIYYFDDFVRNFGNLQQMLEFATNGKFKENNRFAGYVNLPELVRIWSGVADTVLTKEAGGVSDKIPEMQGGKAQDIYLPQTKALRSVMKYVRARLDEYEKMTGKEKKANSHIPLTMYGIAKAAAVDARLVVDGAEDDPNNKTNEAVRQALKSLEESKDYKGTVAIFADNYQNSHSGFNLYEDIRSKLIAQGVDPSEIVVMKSGMTIKKKLDIFEKVNRGEIRVILGSTFTLGTGVNIQERLYTLIHIDAPNRPMDYTQRNGRILRQGNIHKDMGIPVKVLRFGVEDSLDVTAYQRLKTKGAIADSIMNGKHMMNNSMENRSLEEDEDVFGDITAHLSGSEYAMLKNQAEKEVRKLESQYKIWQADQTYIHNQVPRLTGQNKEAEKIRTKAKDALDVLKSKYDAKKAITVNGVKYSDIAAMDKLFKELNAAAKKAQDKAASEQSYSEQRKVKINIGGLDFNFNTSIESKIEKKNGQSTLTFSASRTTTYSCDELGLKDIPVSGGWVKSGVDDIIQNVVTGKDFNDVIEVQSTVIDRNEASIKQLQEREGKPFEHTEELAAAKERLQDYEEKMKVEMAEKEAKYAKMDSEVEEAADVQNAEEAEEENDSEDSKDTNKYRIREDEPPTRTGVGYKVFVLRDGKLYPPMVANPDGAETPTGVWLDADAAPVAGESKTGRLQVQAGGKGTQGGSGRLAYRPGWHLGSIPYALQFNRLNPVTGERELFPANFVWAEVDYADDVDYQEEAMSYGMTPNGKFQHSLAGLPRLPENGSYTYRTNPNPETDPWIITGAMRVRRILTPTEVDAMVEAAGREPQEREAGAITDEQVNKLNKELEKKMDTSEHSKTAAAKQLAKKLGVPVRIVTDVETLTHEDAEIQKRMRNAKGWYSTTTGEVVIVLPNNRSVQDIEQTVFHEIIGHKSLRQLIGDEKMDEFLTQVFNHASKQVRERITALAAKHSWNFNEATEEYLAQLAEKGFEDFNGEERSLWEKVRDFVVKLLQGLKIPKSITLNDNDLRYILWRGYQMQMERGALGEAENVVKQQELGTGHFKFRDGNNTPMGLEEIVTRSSVELAQRHKDNLKLRDDAIKAVGGNLSKLRQAMARQKEFDINTVKSISDLAQTLIENGWFEDLNGREVKRLLSIVKNAVGKQDITEHINTVMDMMVENLLKQGQNNFAKLLSIKGSKVNAQGVEVQGQLDADGAKMVKAMKAGMSLSKEALEEKIAEASDRMSSNDDVIADEAALEYAGLNFALQYVNDIKGSVEEKKALQNEIKTATEDYKAGNFGSKEAYDQFVKSIQDAIRQNKIERVEAYQSLTSALADALRSSIENAKSFKQAEKERIKEIQHNANSDMQGRKSDEHRKDSKLQKIMNSSFVRFFLKPLGTFDQMFRMFGNKSQNGEGYLWNRFVRGWVDATEKEYQGVKSSFKTLDNKVSQVFGKNMRWSDLYSIERKMKKGTVSIKNGDDIQTKELTQGNMLYIYMVDKMSDGRMKLRKMGITEEVVESIKAIIDPRFIELADWMQEEFLVNKRSEYNQVYKRMFGTSMAAIENYFPLKILSNARSENVDVSTQTNEDTKPSTITGSVIKRRRNGLALDITGADAFSVVIEHIQQMEKWAAFAEYNRDLNTLLSYKRFRNQVMNMSSVYGSGKKLWNNFRDVCRIAADTYHPAVGNDSVDATVVNMAKGVTKAKIAFRIYTALKQLLSSPAFLAEASPLHLISNAMTPWKAWNWAMKELPLFEKRWKSRQVGDTRLKETDMDWKFWKTNFVKKLDQWGMSPNAFVDALTISIGAHSIYQTKYAKYRKQGYDHAWADRRAKQDAAVLYNETQQSNENAFLSTMQLDRSVASVALSVFRNSSMGYQRQLVDAIRNLSRVMKRGYREQSIEFMTKQHIRNGLDEAQAAHAAIADFNRGIFRDLTRVALFGFVMQVAWNLGAYLPYLIAGGDDDDKAEMLDDAALHALIGGGVEGLSGGNILSEASNMVAKGESLSSYEPSLLPLYSDVQNIWKHFENDKVAAANDIVNLLIQSGFGVNPQSLTDTAVAIWDACGNEPSLGLCKEATLCVMRVLSCPQSQIDKVYFDELGCNGESASKLTPNEIAERYATYKVKRAASLTDWAYSNESEEARKSSYRDKAKTIAKDKLKKMGDAEINEAYLNYADEAKGVKQQVEAINKMKTTDLMQYAEAFTEVANNPIYVRYRIFERYDDVLDKISKQWLAAKTPVEKAKWEQTMKECKRDMVTKLSENDGQ